MIKQCIAQIASFMQRVAWFLLVVFLCLVCVASVELDAGAVLNISGGRRQWSPFDFAIIIKQALFFLWQKFFIVAMLLFRRGLDEWRHIYYQYWLRNMICMF